MDVSYFVMESECPKCSSEDWKSARLVILEGTTTTSGFFEVNVGRKSHLKDVKRDSLLSDRWFSRGVVISGDVETTNRSVLVDDIKSMLADAGSLRPMPAPLEQFEMPEKPQEPFKLERDRNKILATDPSKLRLPHRPQAPEINLPPKFAARSWFETVVSGFWWSLTKISLVIIGALYFSRKTTLAWMGYVANLLSFLPEASEASGENEPIQLNIPVLSEFFRSSGFAEVTIEVITLTLFAVVVLVLEVFLVAVFARSREQKRRNAYELKVKQAEAANADLLAKYEVAKGEYDKKVADKNRDVEQFAREKELYKEELELYKTKLRAAQKNYETKIADYDAEVEQVKAFRMELWDRARVCTRCGACYLGPQLRSY